MSLGRCGSHWPAFGESWRRRGDVLLALVPLGGNFKSWVVCRDAVQRGNNGKTAVEDGMAERWRPEHSVFQAKSRVRVKRNNISFLKREDASVALDQAEIEEVASTFYKNLFTAQDDLDPNLILQHVPRKINETMNDRMLRPYSAGEVERALFAMGANKAPRPDGFTAGFYQLHWDLLGANVTDGVLEFLNGGILPENLNRTTLVLIPKTRNPQDMKEFRPISLCNVLYKICSKVLTLRLMEFLD